ncbi:glycine/betaine ABC transporter substrate-binding protein [Streptomyces sp. 3MP-14]|uniref:Glycine/betaine ABC transporter substrate-binding protein n=1 Tax=Streptomyces mimosae TaxID=2586635 RepID=A0A5N6A9K4_9ACTN|nr:MULTISPECIES: glycine betaine ABC transporter substrate-binding protein [Streptomyces]KAB8165331.1 glycine/betaine ABC transporter substrate-binding protein [Streptomyces mimosae]KAB8175963.1 glycine/betaine ABC transporter substrate-binding protein [Streptomyces sp. 3MP-14]
MPRISPRIRRLAPHRLLAGLGALGLVFSSACDLPGELLGAQEREPVRIAVTDWPGARANAAVVAYLLEEELGVPVEKVETEPAASWAELGAGDTQVLLEDWGGLPDQTRLHVEQRGDVVAAGELGISGHVGWYIPGEFAEAHPEVLNWRNLNDFAEQLGGRILQADPGFATRDATIIDELGLDLTPVAAGSEDALVDEIHQAGSRGTPLLAYFWQPHWLATKVELAEVELPDYYPTIPLRKYLNAEFAEEGGEVVDFLRAFSWSERDQNAVAELIAGQGLTPRAAAERWVEDNPDTVAAWFN